MKRLTATLFISALTLTAVALALPPHGGLQLLAVMLTFAGLATGARSLELREG